VLTEIQKVRLECGDTQLAPFQIMSDEEVQYFLDKNSSSIRRASLDCAKSILFKLSSQVDSRADILEVFGSQYSRSYKEALMIYLKDQNFSIVGFCQPYAGGISKEDIYINITTSDNNYVEVLRGVPQENDGYNLNSDVFTQIESIRNNPFGV
jgi:hypothetical protein